MPALKLKSDAFPKQTKEPKATKSDAPPPQAASPPERSAGAAKLELEELKAKVSKSACCRPCFKVLFMVLTLVTIVQAIAEIVVTVSTAIATRLYGSEQSGRLVGMVILAILAAVTISILIYAVIATCKNQSKPLHTAAIVLVIVAIVQAVVTGVAVKVSEQDELNFTRDLTQSFRLARENYPRHSTLWSSMQHELNCCGVRSPNDYRSSNLPDYFAPNVPISCCPKYDPERSELVQERERENCKARKTYYDIGCQVLALEALKTAAHMVMGLTVSLIVLELLLSITASILYRKMKRMKSRRNDDENPKP